MSRVSGKKIATKGLASCSIIDGKVQLTAANKKMELPVPLGLEVNIDNEAIKIAFNDEERKAIAGTFRSLLANAVKGLTEGFKTTLKLNGLGYKATLTSPSELVMQLGYSHDVPYTIPNGVQATLEKQDTIHLASHDKALLGSVCKAIIAFRPPEPFKGKGIMIAGQYVRRKKGKK